MITLKLMCRIVGTIILLLIPTILWINTSINIQQDNLEIILYDYSFTISAMLTAFVFACIFWFIEDILYFIPQD
jgi:hypothetical protein